MLELVFAALVAVSNSSAPAEDFGGISASQLIVGGVSLGDSQARVRQILGQPLEVREEVLENPGDPPSQTYLYPKLEIFFLDQEAYNVQATGSQYRTAKGARVGDSIQRIMKLYGKSPVQGQTGVLRYNVTGTDTWLLFHYAAGRVARIELWFDYT